MAPLKQPLSLLELCLSSSASLVEASCCHVFLEHGGYGYREAERAVEDIQVSWRKAIITSTLICRL